MKTAFFSIMMFFSLTSLWCMENIDLDKVHIIYDQIAFFDHMDKNSDKARAFADEIKDEDLKKSYSDTLFFALNSRGEAGSTIKEWLKIFNDAGATFLNFDLMPKDLSSETICKIKTYDGKELLEYIPRSQIESFIKSKNSFVNPNEEKNCITLPNHFSGELVEQLLYMRERGFNPGNLYGLLELANYLNSEEAYKHLQKYARDVIIRDEDSIFCPYKVTIPLESAEGLFNHIVRGDISYYVSGYHSVIYIRFDEDETLELRLEDYNLVNGDEQDPICIEKNKNQSRKKLIEKKSGHEVTRKTIYEIVAKKMLEPHFSKDCKSFKIDSSLLRLEKLSDKNVQQLPKKSTKSEFSEYFKNQGLKAGISAYKLFYDEEHRKNRSIANLIGNHMKNDFSPAHRSSHKILGSIEMDLD